MNRRGKGEDLWNEAEALFNKKNWAGFTSLFAADAVHVDPIGRREKREAIGAYFAEAGEAFSDISFPASLLLENGDTVVAEYPYRATHTGPLTMPNGSVGPASGNAQDFPGVTIIEVREGKIPDLRDYFDLAIGMTQLWLMPES